MRLPWRSIPAPVRQTRTALPSVYPHSFPWLSFGLSRPFVANILKSLCRKGFVASQRGVKGGYLLRAEASGRTLADLMDCLGDSFYLAECNRASPDECCVLFASCPVKGAVAAVHRRLRDVLAGVTLAELFGYNGPQISPITPIKELVFLNSSAESVQSADEPG